MERGRKMRKECDRGTERDRGGGGRSGKRRKDEERNYFLFLILLGTV